MHLLKHGQGVTLLSGQQICSSLVLFADTMCISVALLSPEQFAPCFRVSAMPFRSLADHMHARADLKLDAEFIVRAVHKKSADSSHTAQICSPCMKCILFCTNSGVL